MKTQIGSVTTILLLVASFAHAGEGPAGGRLDAPRVAPLAPEAAREAMTVITGVVPEGPVLNIFRTLQHHPRLVEAWTGFGRYVLAESTLPPRHREMAMLRIGWLCQSDYEFGQHARIALNIGISQAEILAITKGPTDPTWNPFERALLKGVDELHSEAMVSDPTWAALSEQYSVQQMMDYVFTVGQYNLVSMALNSLGVEREEGVAGFPENAVR